MTVSLTPLPCPPLLSSGVTGYAVGYPLPEELADPNLPKTMDLPRELARAAQQRKIEFWAGRECAREALHSLGFEGKAALSIGEARRPVWPEGFLGSITHGHGFAWAAVAPRTLLLGLGIDSEPVLEGQVFEDVREQVASPKELAELNESGLSLEESVTALFCAKECLFKCLNPVCDRFFDFPDAHLSKLHHDGSEGRFEIRLETTLSPELTKGFQLAGRFQLQEGRIFAALEWRVRKEGEP